MHPMPHRLFTEEEYLTIERAADYKSEYVDGGIYAMAGAGREHSLLISNLSGLLYAQFRGRACEFYTNDMRVRVADGGLYTYPDLTALCGAPRLLDQRNDTLLNPQLIVEVLSPSTASYDRGEKWRRYRRLESLTDYILVAQEKMWIEHWSRQDGDTWRISEYEQPSDRLHLAALQAELSLADIYERVVFPPQMLPPAR